MSPIPEERSGELTPGEVSDYELGGGLPAWCERTSDHTRQAQPSKCSSAHLHREEIADAVPVTPESLNVRSMEFSGPSCQGCQAIEPASEQTAGSPATVVHQNLQEEQEEEHSAQNVGTAGEQEPERTSVWWDIAWDTGPALCGCMLPLAACVTLWCL